MFDDSFSYAYKNQWENRTSNTHIIIEALLLDIMSINTNMYNR